MELNDTQPQTDLRLSTVLLGGCQGKEPGTALSEHHQGFSREQS